MEFGFRVYMNKRDVTDWVTTVELEHPRNTLYRQWTFNFAGWSSIEEGAEWDLFGSYDPTGDPRAEVLARAGRTPPDRERDRLIVEAGKIPTLRVRGYDFVWSVQRKRPRETIIVVPSSAYIVEEIDGRPVLLENSVAGAIRRYEGPIGKYRVWTNVRTIPQCVKRLGNAAGVRVDYRLPSANMIPLVIDPTLSYWEAMIDLAKPWKPKIYYRDSINTLVLADPLHSHYQVGTTLTVPARTVVRMTGAPIKHKRTRRILIRIPPCR